MAKIKQYWCIPDFSDTMFILRIGNIWINKNNKDTSADDYVIGSKFGKELWEKYNEMQFNPRDRRSILRKLRKESESIRNTQASDRS